MNKIKRFFLQFRLKYLGNKQLVVRKTLNYSQVQHIGLLIYTTQRSTSSTINRFMKTLLEDGKTVDALVYVEEQKENPYGFKYDICTEKEVNLLGNITQPKVHEFMAKNFDYLYCVCVEKSEVIDFVVKNSRAKCRIGFYDGQNADNFDFMLQLKANEGVEILVEQFLHYTKNVLVKNL